jgi:hypothetical protein
VIEIDCPDALVWHYAQEGLVALTLHFAETTADDTDPPLHPSLPALAAINALDARYIASLPADCRRAIDQLADETAFQPAAVNDWLAALGTADPLLRLRIGLVVGARWARSLLHSYLDREIEAAQLQDTLSRDLARAALHAGQSCRERIARHIAAAHPEHRGRFLAYTVSWPATLWAVFSDTAAPELLPKEEVLRQHHHLVQAALRHLVADAVDDLFLESGQRN